MTVFLIAGPELSVSALHCASVGVGRAVIDNNQANAAHWRAAAAADQGYRLAGRVEPAVSAGAVELARAPRDATTADLIATIPADLSIPDFLRRAR
jgi:hypothetical protein